MLDSAFYVFGVCLTLMLGLLCGLAGAVMFPNSGWAYILCAGVGLLGGYAAFVHRDDGYKDE